MPKTIKKERLRWIEPILKKELKILDLVRVCPYSERSIKRLLTSHRKNDIEDLISNKI
jgi:hypothetical protein